MSAPSDGKKKWSDNYPPLAKFVLLSERPSYQSYRVPIAIVQCSSKVSLVTVHDNCLRQTSDCR